MKLEGEGGHTALPGARDSHSMQEPRELLGRAAEKEGHKLDSNKRGHWREQQIIIPHVRFHLLGGTDMQHVSPLIPP